MSSIPSQRKAGSQSLYYVTSLFSRTGITGIFFVGITAACLLSVFYARTGFCAQGLISFTDVFSEAYNHAGIYLKKNHLWDFPGTVAKKIKPTFELSFLPMTLLFPWVEEEKQTHQPVPLETVQQTDLGCECQPSYNTPPSSCYQGNSADQNPTPACEKGPCILVYFQIQALMRTNLERLCFKASPLISRQNALCF